MGRLYGLLKAICSAKQHRLFQSMPRKQTRFFQFRQTVFFFMFFPCIADFVYYFNLFIFLFSFPYYFTPPFILIFTPPPPPTPGGGQRESINKLIRLWWWWRFWKRGNELVSMLMEAVTHTHRQIGSVRACVFSFRRLQYV